MKYFLYLILLWSILSCHSKDSESERHAYYLFIAHTRTDQNPAIDLKIEAIDLNKYDLLMLGGDLSELTTESEFSMEYITKELDLSSNRTLFTAGNHDYTHPELISKFTGRPTFYASFNNGITTVVLDTEIDNCNISDEQLKMVTSVCDTIQKSSHLIVLTHKLIWMYNHADLEDKAEHIPNAPIGSKAHMINPNNFNRDVLPLLTMIQKRGIQTICVAGDIGFKVKAFEYQDQNGIWFLASGVNYKDDKNFGLRFDHNLDRKEITWQFVPVEQL